MYCGESTLVKYEKDQRTAVTLTCKAWTCPDCAPNRKRRLIAEACGGLPNKMLTLTSRRHGGTTAPEAARALAHAWRLLRLRAMRRYRLKDLPFIAVFEATKLGWPHLHILLRGPWLDQAWLSEQMSQLTDSPNVDIRKIDNPGRAASYVAKYIGKEPTKFETCKRYWKSKQYEQRDLSKVIRPAHERRGFEIERRAIASVVAMWRSFEWRVEWLDHHRARCWIPP